jgi:ADP-ribose pyrophosphatase YjhB (NUDIX family)
MKISSGILVILNKEKILLCHPTNSAWSKTFSPPKGGIDKGEKLIDGAIRETKEEIGVSISKDRIENPTNPLVIDYKNSKNEIYKRVYFFTIEIKDISEIGLKSEIIDKSDLQLDEIDWAGFLSKKEMKPKLFKRYGLLMDLIKY